MQGRIENTHESSMSDVASFLLYCLKLVSSLCDFLFNENSTELRVEQFERILNKHLPPLKGDEVTFIGSTFMKS